VNDPFEKQSANRRFMTTQWTHVLSTRGESAAAKQSLKELCDRYYAPVFAFVESYTRHHQNARDWTHAFFATLLEGRSLDSVIRERGKFRSYLLGAVKHFLADERAKQKAEKRGGLVSHISVDFVVNSQTESAAHSSMPPDAYFDRHWAMAILKNSLTDFEMELGREHAAKFQTLRPWLSGDSIELSHAEVTASLGVSTEVVKTTIHRWRKRFRELVKGHIGSTVANASEVDDELGYLIQALAAKSQ
jgi:DNA-directed RNA polymerase specialized sigma24 family protein